LWLPLRNRRHVSELCSEPAALLETAGFAPSALPVSASSCPVMGNPLRIWYRVSAALRSLLYAPSISPE
jgi:hypothetical protein